MSSNQGVSKVVALLQTALETARCESADNQRHLEEVQHKLDGSQTRVSQLSQMCSVGA